MGRIVERFKQIESTSDFVVVEGADFTGASSIEFEVNVRIAEHLGLPIVAVVDGHAIIVNRVEPAALETLDDALAHTELDDPVWAIAEVPTLRQPSLDQRPYVLAGGEVVVIGTTDWVFGLAVDAAVSKVTANSLDRYVGR